jgi:hypothetical protein
MKKGQISIQEDSLDMGMSEVPISLQKTILRKTYIPRKQRI